MIRTLLLATALVAAAGGAFAQGGPRLVNGPGDGPQVVYDAPSTNIVGGGNAMIVGTADSRSVVAGQDSPTQARSGLVASIVGGGTERQLVYAPAAGTTPRMAARGLRSGG